MVDVRPEVDVPSEINVHIDAARPMQTPRRARSDNRILAGYFALDACYDVAMVVANSFALEVRLCLLRRKNWRS